MYKIKQIPEDFKVEEVINIDLSEGDYTYFRLIKKSYNTLDVLESLSDFLNLPMKALGFAGSKDRNAITQQAISIKTKDPEKIKNFKKKDVQLEFIGIGKNPISLGDLEGNKFEIVIRNIKEKPQQKKFFVNYFGEQRFSLNNADIGRAIIKKDFKKAVELVDDKLVQEYLKKKPNDHIGAIILLPLKLRMMFVHAYQSFIWNKAAEEYVKNHKEFKEIEIPLVGFGTEYEDKEIENIIKAILKEEGITERDFIIQSMKELSQEGSTRNLYVEIENLEVGELEEDELNKDMKKCLVKFFLKKGCYATEAVKALI